MRLNQERQIELTPKRFVLAINELSKLGIEVTEKDETSIKFFFKNEVVTLYLYSGWFTGKTVNDGRGIHELLKQLK